MAITLTDRAAQHVQNYIAKRGKGLGVALANVTVAANDAG